MTDDTRFDTELVFTPNHYYYFFPDDLLPERIEREFAVLWKVLELRPGMEVLDLACGNGRIANALAARGYAVTGLDLNPCLHRTGQTECSGKKPDSHLPRGRYALAPMDQPL